MTILQLTHPDRRVFTRAVTPDIETLFLTHWRDHHRQNQALRADIEWALENGARLLIKSVAAQRGYRTYWYEIEFPNNALAIQWTLMEADESRHYSLRAV